MTAKSFALRIIVAVLISWGFYMAVDYLAVSGWNSSESLIVRAISAGPEHVIPSDGEDAYETLERDT
ncbi:MAG: hypothetical protein IJP89_03815, partial [Synergistaceae bacterium]|nr:hypothetical protein [Synergistaceae bacterium]